MSNTVVLTILPLLLGVLLDSVFGDPISLPHPIVWFGKLISHSEHAFNNGKHRKLKGAVIAITLIVCVFTVTWAILRLINCIPVNIIRITLGVATRTILVFYCLAGKTLINEVLMVFEAMEESLERGRQQVARIVGRDTSELTAQEVRAAALETLAENLSDGVIAPLFWFTLLGVPGMMAYKMVNTLDSMIGYKNERYQDFGCWAAHIDDIANWIPARLTAMLMIFANGTPNLTGFVRKYGRQHASPNSGFPESALAGILDCRFGGTHNYFGVPVYKPYIGKTARDFSFHDVKTAIRINRRSQLLMVIISLIVSLLMCLSTTL